ncbi:hypothetical protein ACH4GK_15250 [Streptomyces rimosus]|uniref:hypothetical protein n=1 Tax=Streptomyces rimosus TaxID=1927 RepID=UPI000D146056|nr:hypothetical protein [Streptomyces rimosus]
MPAPSPASRPLPPPWTVQATPPGPKTVTATLFERPFATSLPAGTYCDLLRAAPDACGGGIWRLSPPPE